MMLVTLQQAKNHLRVDNDEQDNEIAMYAEGASDAVINYLTAMNSEAADAYLDSAGEAIDELVPSVIKNATLIMIGYLFRHRDDNEGEAFERGYLPKPVTALLFPLRDPAHA